MVALKIVRESTDITGRVRRVLFTVEEAAEGPLQKSLYAYPVTRAVARTWRGRTGVDCGGDVPREED